MSDKKKIILLILFYALLCLLIYFWGSSMLVVNAKEFLINGNTFSFSVEGFAHREKPPSSKPYYEIFSANSFKAPKILTNGYFDDYSFINRTDRDKYELENDKNRFDYGSFIPTRLDFTLYIDKNALDYDYWREHQDNIFYLNVLLHGQYFYNIRNSEQNWFSLSKMANLNDSDSRRFYPYIFNSSTGSDVSHSSLLDVSKPVRKMHTINKDNSLLYAYDDFVGFTLQFNGKYITSNVNDCGSSSFSKYCLPVSISFDEARRYYESSLTNYYYKNWELDNSPYPYIPEFNEPATFSISKATLSDVRPDMPYTFTDFEFFDDEESYTFYDEGTFRYPDEQDTEPEQKEFTILGFLQDIWIAITNIPSFLISIPSRIVQSVSDIHSFFVNIFDKIGDFFSNFFDRLIKLFSRLIIPDDPDYFKNQWLSNFDLFEEKLGFLFTPFEILEKVLNKYNELGEGSGIISIPDIKDPVFNKTLISKTDFNLKEIFSTGEIGKFHDIYLIFVDVIIFVNLCNLGLKKFHSIVEDRGGDL